MSQSVNIPGIFSDIASKVNTVFSERPSSPFKVFFEHGVYDAVNKVLGNRDQSPDMETKLSFPLIWLVTPVSQKPVTEGDANCEIDAQVFILAEANDEYTEDQQISESFIPYLRPIYKEFLKQIDLSCAFQVLCADAIVHDMKEWTYQSTTDGKRHLFKNKINAIQIKGMRLLVNEPTPETFRIFN